MIRVGSRDGTINQNIGDLVEYFPSGTKDKKRKRKSIRMLFRKTWRALLSIFKFIFIRLKYLNTILRVHNIVHCVAAGIWKAFIKINSEGKRLKASKIFVWGASSREWVRIWDLKLLFWEFGKSARMEIRDFGTE